MKRALLFRSVREVIAAERLLSERGLHPVAVAVPRSLSSECGVCLRISEEEAGAADELLAGKGIGHVCARFVED